MVGRIAGEATDFSELHYPPGLKKRVSFATVWVYLIYIMMFATLYKNAGFCSGSEARSYESVCIWARGVCGAASRIVSMCTPAE